MVYLEFKNSKEEEIRKARVQMACWKTFRKIREWGIVKCGLRADRLHRLGDKVRGKTQRKVQDSERTSTKLEAKNKANRRAPKRNWNSKK